MDNKRASNKTIIIVAIVFFPTTIYWLIGMGILFIQSKYSDILEELREYSAAIFESLDDKEIWNDFLKISNITVIAVWVLSSVVIILYQVLLSIILISSSLLALLVNVFVEITNKISPN